MVEVDEIHEKTADSGVTIKDDLKLSSGNAIKNASGTDLLTEAGVLGSSVTGDKIAKAWVNYNQTIPAINDSFNVSSVSDDSAGIFTVNFNFTWSSTSYAVSSWVRSEYTDSYARCISARSNHSKTTTAMVFLTSVSGNDLARDMPESGLIFFGD